MTLSNSLEQATRSVAVPDRMNGLTIKKATPFHATRLVNFLKRFDEIAFCDWQSEDLLKGLLSHDNTFCYLAENHSGAIIGAVAGGRWVHAVPSTTWQCRRTIATAASARP